MSAMLTIAAPYVLIGIGIIGLTALVWRIFTPIIKPTKPTEHVDIEWIMHRGGKNDNKRH